jgi:hypothetical protein
MKIEITAVPRYWLHMSLPHAKLLQKLSSMHYDAKCKSAGLVGGFLYGWIPTHAVQRGAGRARRHVPERGWHADSRDGDVR